MRRLFLSACALALSISYVSASAKPLPVKEWVRLPEFKNVIISPKGTYLAVVSSPKDSDRYQLVVFNTRDVLANHPKIVAHFGLAEYEKFAGVRWSNDERLLAWTARQFGGLDRPEPDGDLYAVNAHGGQLKHLMGQHGGGQLGYRTSGTNQMVFFAGLLSLMPQEPNIVLVQGYVPGSNVPSAYALDTVTDVFHRVVTGIYGGGMMADHSGVVRLMWGFNEKTGEPRLEYRSAGSEDWKDITSVVRSDNEGKLALAHGGPLMFGPDNNSVYYEQYTDNAAETLGLFRFDLKTWKSTLLFANKTVNAGIGEFPDTPPYITSFDNKSIVGLRIMPGKIDTRALDVKAPRIQLLAGLQNAFQGKDVEIVSHTLDGAEAIVKVWGDTTPGQYYLYSSKPKPSVTLLFSETPWIKADNLSPMQPVTYQARDGTTIHGYLTLPRGSNGKNLPLIVYVHGGPHGIRYDWGFDATGFDLVATQILANHGFAVLAPNYRGSGGYGYKFLHAGFKHWGDTMQDDLADAVKWAVKKGIADPKRTCILGASYGGYASLMSAERFPDMFQCAVGYSGVYDLPMLKTRKSIFERNAIGRLTLEAYLGHDQKQLRAFSPVFQVGSLKAAVFLLHGGEDKRAPADGYREMVRAIRKHGTPLETMYERNEGHGFYKPAHRARAWTRILAFLDKYIGPDAGKASGSAAN